jgi:DNA-binding beta-propeller fold protein YncE
MNINYLNTLLPILLLTGCVSAPVTPDKWSIEPVSLYDSDHEKGTEIISMQQSTLRAVLSNFETGEVDLLDISRPQHLQRKARFALKLCKGEELTSVAFHPSLDLFAAVIDAGNKPGRLEIRSASTGLLIDRVVVGFGPDAVVFSPDGNLAMIANEGEDFLFEPSTKQFFTPEGSISIVRLSKFGHIIRHKNLELADMTYHEGFVITGTGRFMEREIDWNVDGIISKKMDFDGNGVIEKKKVILGHFEGHDVFGTETNGERKILIPIKTHSPALLEPEYISISPDASKAYVTLQEDDAVAVIDLINELVISYYGLGATRHKTDARYEGWVKFDQSMTGLREPDGITTVANGRYFVTADEGDTDMDSSLPADGQPISGGRSVSVFDASTGTLLGDTGNQLDEVAFANKVYPERRSSKKGSEPEMLVSFDLDGVTFVAVAMERAGAVELISLADPFHPKVVALGKIAGDEDKSPEGIAHYEVAGEHYLLTANEMNGTVECFKIIRKDANTSIQ